jgi:hypothetical protein
MFGNAVQFTRRKDLPLRVVPIAVRIAKELRPGTREGFGGRGKLDREGGVRHIAVPKENTLATGQQNNGDCVAAFKDAVGGVGNEQVHSGGTDMIQT